MKIDSSAVGMESTRSYRETNVTLRRFVVSQYTGSEAAELQTAVDDNGARTGAGNTKENKNGRTGNAEGNRNGRAGNAERNSSALTENTEENGQAESTEEGRTVGRNKTGDQAVSLNEWQRMQASTGRYALRSSESQTLAAIRHRTVQYIFELLFAYRRNRLGDWGQGNGYGNTSGSGADQVLQQGVSASGKNKVQPPRSPAATVRVLNYTQETIHVESENTVFSSVGTVKTADGREINFDINVGMSREFQSRFSEDLKLATFTLCDPLVINLDSDVADVKDQTFYFDLDADGEMDEISRLGKGSGYLALDQNGDGVINDGSELFGTKSGNGFADLAKYDQDGNGWIDENDAVWDKLKIWCKDENGKDVLYRLADKGVGAICLQNTAADFTLQGQGGKTQGVVRSTGVFLYENGLAGTIQHVDMAKYDMGA